MNFRNDFRKLMWKCELEKKRKEGGNRNWQTHSPLVRKVGAASGQSENGRAVPHLPQCSPEWRSTGILLDSQALVTAQLMFLSSPLSHSVNSMLSAQSSCPLVSIVKVKAHLDARRNKYPLLPFV